MRKFVPLVLLGLAPLSVSAGVLDAQVTEHSLESTDGLELINVSAEVVEHEGRRGLGHARIRRCRVPGRPGGPEPLRVLLPPSDQRPG